MGCVMVREAEFSDINRIVKVVMNYRAFYEVENQTEKEVHDFIEMRMTNNQSKIFIYENRNKKIAGFIQLYPSYSTVSLKAQWILNDFFVDENYRNQGIGQELMAFVKNYFADKAKGFILVTEKSNSRAKAFYEKNSWKTGEYDFYTYFYE